MRRFSAGIVAAVVSAGMLQASAGWAAEGGAQAAAPAADGIDWSAVDRSVDPCKDFYRRACGGFLARSRPSAQRPQINMTEEQFDANLEAALGRLFTVKAQAGSELGRLETFYGACMAGGGAADAAEVGRWLARIDAVASAADVQAMIRELAAIGVEPFFSYSGQPDPQALDRYRGEIESSSTWQDPAIVARTFAAAGMGPDEAKAEAARVAAVITELRKHRAKWDDPASLENPRTWDQIAPMAPAVDWAAYRAMVGARADRPVNLTSLTYLPAVSHELATRTPQELRAYLKWAFLFSLRGELPAPYDQAMGDLPAWGRVDLGSRPRRCRDATVRAMGVEFSRQYSLKLLGLDARAAAQKIGREVQGEIVKSVRDADWLSPAARAATADKLARTDLKIGFPDAWPATGRFALRGDRFLGNVLEARRFEARRAWQQAGRTRSRTGWEMLVQPWVGTGMAAARLVVPNGFPDAYSNSLIMTAAFLTPPRFDRAAAEEENYGTFGAVFAHEFVHILETHDFDAEGRQKEMWSAADLEAAKARRQCVIAQADQYAAPAGVKMSGASNYDENVADLGGLRLAYEALAARLGPALEAEDAQGMSPAKRFFYKYAQGWCTAATDAELAKVVKEDGHALPEYRTNGPLSNLPGFGRAFSCKAGDPMMRRREDICRVW